VAPTVPLLNRERAILQFNRRVLAQAQRADVPLLERLRYVTIVSSNLDEFFEVRVADLVEAGHRPGSGVSRQDLQAVDRGGPPTGRRTSTRCSTTIVMPALQREGIVVLNHAERDAAQRQWVKHFFETQVRPAAGAGEPGPQSPLSASRQQVVELHRAPGWP
jgi:polyphosphate kinase